MDDRVEVVVERLRAHANPANVAGMARYGIQGANLLGVNLPTLRALARELGKDHALAAALYFAGYHEARILASLVDRPQWVEATQMEAWARLFDSWDLVDQVCANLFARAPAAIAVALDWTARDEVFVKRAGFVILARQAVTEKQAPDELFLEWLPLVSREAADGRNFVKKAVSWTLRQIGKRNDRLQAAALTLADELAQRPAPAARWIGRDARRDLCAPRRPRKEQS